MRGEVLTEIREMIQAGESITPSTKYDVASMLYFFLLHYPQDEAFAKVTRNDWEAAVYTFLNYLSENNIKLPKKYGLIPLAWSTACRTLVRHHPKFRSKFLGSDNS